jgi:pimeloyl-ACP methyl ester carboxylesterase
VLDLAGFIEHFTDEPAIVFGWSQAGMLLPRLAQLRPDLVRALVFANAVRERTLDPTDLRVPGRIVPDSVYPSLEAAADHLRTTDEVSREEMVGFLSGGLYRREDGMYAWGPPSTSPARSKPSVRWNPTGRRTSTRAWTSRPRDPHPAEAGAHARARAAGIPAGQH